MEKASDTRELTMKGSRKAAPTPKRTMQIHVRCTPTEKAKIQANAYPYGSMSDFLRKLGLKQALKPRPSDDVKEFIGKLDRIAVNINQQTKALNTIALLLKQQKDPDLDLVKIARSEDPSETLEVINNIYDAITKYFS